jgi:hypothetical protein
MITAILVSREVGLAMMIAAIFGALVVIGLILTSRDDS